VRGKIVTIDGVTRLKWVSSSPSSSIYIEGTLVAEAERWSLINGIFGKGGEGSDDLGTFSGAAMFTTQQAELQSQAALPAPIARDPAYTPPSFGDLMEDMGGDQVLLPALLTAGYGEHEFEADGMKLTALQVAVIAVPFNQFGCDVCDGGGSGVRFQCVSCSYDVCNSSAPLGALRPECKAGHTCKVGGAGCTPAKAVAAIQTLADGGAGKAVLFTPPDGFPGGAGLKTLTQLAMIEELQGAAEVVAALKALYPPDEQAVSGVPGTELRCPSDHAMARFATPNGSFNCDACTRRSLPIGEMMTGCRICNYDVCDNCSGVGRPVVADGVLAFEVSGGMLMGRDGPCAGLYEQVVVEGYSGAPGYRKAGTMVTMFRWQRMQWILADLSCGTVADTDNRLFFIVCDPVSETPPVGQWENEAGSTIQVRIAGGQLSASGAGTYICVQGGAGVAIRSRPSESSTRSNGATDGEAVQADQIVNGEGGVRYIQLSGGRGFCPLVLSGDTFFRQMAAAAPGGSGARLTVGDRVTEASSRSDNFMKLGSVGEIVEDDHSSAPYLVERAGGDRHWYRECEVERAGCGNGGGGGGGRLAAGDQCVLAAGGDNDGPLDRSSHRIGTIVRDDHSGRPFQVKRADGSSDREYWYYKRDLERATGAGGGGSGGGGGGPFTKVDEGCSCWLRLSASDEGPVVHGRALTLERFDSVGSVKVSGYWVDSSILQKTDPSGAGGGGGGGSQGQRRARLTLTNDLGREVVSGLKSARSSQKDRNWYCAVQQDIAGTDGQCGPSNGPQCDSCMRYQADQGPPPVSVQDVAERKTANKYKKQALRSAAEDGKLEKVRKYLDAGVDPNAQDERSTSFMFKGQTPLHQAALFSCSVLMDILLLL